MRLKQQLLRLPEPTRWRLARVAYYWGLAMIFVTIVAGGASWIMFHKLTWIWPRDFIPSAQRCVPVVRMIKQYQLDNGRLPNDHELENAMPALRAQGSSIFLGMRNGRAEWLAEYNHRVAYDFTPGREGWYVSGSYTNGRIPLPTVQVAPSAGLTTAPQPAN